MALLGKTKTTKKAAAPKATKEVSVPAAAAAHSGANHFILRPHITEKSGVMSQMGMYTFQVSRQANKQLIAQAVRSLYKVTPVKVALINLPTRNVVVRGRRGAVAGIRKAIVTVKKGEKIDFV